VESLSWKIKRGAFFLLLFAVCCGRSDKELTIEQIGKSGSYPDCRVGYCDGTEKRPCSPCVDSIRYYTIANYERFAPDSLYRILNAHINSKYLCEIYVENCDYRMYFYKKPLFANYEKYIPDALCNETGGLYEYRHKLVALIYSHTYYDSEVTTVTTVLYNTSNIFSRGTDTLYWEKEDTLMGQTNLKE